MERASCARALSPSAAGHVSSGDMVTSCTNSTARLPLALPPALPLDLPLDLPRALRLLAPRRTHLVARPRCSPADRVTCSCALPLPAARGGQGGHAAWQQAAEIMARGDLVPSSMIVAMLRRKLRGKRCSAASAGWPFGRECRGFAAECSRLNSLFISSALTS